MEDLESYDQYSVIIKNNGEKKYYKLVETTKENLEKELRDVNKEYIEYCKNYEESRINEIRRRLAELSGLGYEIIASSEELELSIVRKDGVYYNLNLEVIEKPSFEETILTFYESVLYYEYIEKKRIQVKLFQIVFLTKMISLMIPLMIVLIPHFNLK